MGPRGNIMAKEVKKPQQNASLEAFMEEIHKLAEENYKKRIASDKPGDAMSDWLQAEKEVKKKHKL
jgi:hypothetical protein